MRASSRKHLKSRRHNVKQLIMWTARGFCLSSCRQTSILAGIVRSHICWCDWTAYAEVMIASGIDSQAEVTSGAAGCQLQATGSPRYPSRPALVSRFGTSLADVQRTYISLLLRFLVNLTWSFAGLKTPDLP
jgi:hypothetical protein